MVLLLKLFITKNIKEIIYDNQKGLQNRKTKTSNVQFSYKLLRAVSEKEL